jgi:large subunit ribosomal protein L6
MVQVIQKEVPIVAGVEVTVDNAVIQTEGPLGKLKRDLWYPNIEISVEKDKVCIASSVNKKTQKSIIGTYASHVANMMSGVAFGFQYKLKLVYSHFPIQVNVEGRTISIDNFLGERKPRSARIMGESSVVVQGDELVVSGIDKEDVGQTAANIEQATRIKGRDPRVFQDGIYLVEKGLGARA